MQPAGRVHMPSIAILVICAIGLVTALASAAGLFASGLIGVFSNGSSQRQVTSLFSLAWISGLVALLLVPGLVNAFLRVIHRPADLFQLPGQGRFTALNVATALLVLWPFTLAAGALISERGTALAWMLLPPIQILAIMLPLWWLLELGRRGLPTGGSQRSWGLLSFSLVVTPTLIIILEIVLLLAIVVGIGFWVSTQPALASQLNSLARRLMNSRGDTTSILSAIQPILAQPLVIYGILATMGGFIPILEELLKPLGVWGLIGRPITPAEGFTAGLLCGFTFATFESLGAISNPVADAWLLTVIGRFGTGLLHTTSAGLIGWGLASAWNPGHFAAFGRYTRLGLIFLVSFSLHGLWNIFSMLLGLSPFIGPAAANTISMAVAQRLGLIAPVVLAILTVTMFLILLGSNSILRKGTPPGILPAPAAPVSFEPDRISPAGEDATLTAPDGSQIHTL